MISVVVTELYVKLGFDGVVDAALKAVLQSSGAILSQLPKLQFELATVHKLIHQTCVPSLKQGL
jgi:hypothetical protein